MHFLRRTLHVLFGLLLIATLVALYFIASPNLPLYQPPTKVHYLNQWTAEQRQIYYYTPQVLQSLARAARAAPDCWYQSPEKSRLPGRQRLQARAQSAIKRAAALRSTRLTALELVTFAPC